MESYTNRMEEHKQRENLILYPGGLGEKNKKQKMPEDGSQNNEETPRPQPDFTQTSRRASYESENARRNERKKKEDAQRINDEKENVRRNERDKKEDTFGIDELSSEKE